MIRETTLLVVRGIWRNSFAFRLDALLTSEDAAGFRSYSKDRQMWLVGEEVLIHH
jgi:hypothetical protein